MKKKSFKPDVPIVPVSGGTPEEALEKLGIPIRKDLVMGDDVDDYLRAKMNNHPEHKKRGLLRGIGRWLTSNNGGTEQ